MNVQSKNKYLTCKTRAYLFYRNYRNFMVWPPNSKNCIVNQAMDILGMESPDIVNADSCIPTGVIMILKQDLFT